MNNQICPYDLCVGCCACMNICPESCIDMQEDRWGEIHPSVNEELCVKCGRCRSVCPANTERKANPPLACYVAWSRDARIRKTCSSGGLATEMARTFVAQGGYVFCVDWDEEMNLTYRCVSEGHALMKSKGSRYVQSYIGKSLREAKEQLEKGQPLLFIGLPCQIDGLYGFLGKDYDHLFCIDFVCHGAPPIRYLQAYIAFLGKVFRRHIDKVDFRDEHGYTFAASSQGDLIRRDVEDLYFALYGRGTICRQCCYRCKYATAKTRVGDLTLGDFHGIGRLAPYAGPRKTSLLLVNSPKGIKAIRACGNRLTLEERPMEEAVKGNPQLRRSPVVTDEHRRFRRTYPFFGFVISALLTKAARRYLQNRIRRVFVSSQKGK